MSSYANRPPRITTAFTDTAGVHHEWQFTANTNILARSQAWKENRNTFNAAAYACWLQTQTRARLERYSRTAPDGTREDFLYSEKQGTDKNAPPARRRVRVLSKKH